MKSKYQAFGELDPRLQHHSKNPFTNKAGRKLNSGEAVIETMGGDLDDADQETPRIKYNELTIPDSQILAELRHSKTGPLLKAKAKDAHLGRSQTFPAEDCKDRLQTAEITEGELEVFTVMFKDKLKLSPFLKDQFELVASLPAPSAEQVEQLALSLPSPKRPKLSDKSVVFDLDDTLVYVMTDEKLANAKMTYKANIKRTSYIASRTGKSITINVVIRPYALEMLQQLAPYYEIIVFTAAAKSYGDAIIDVLDPDNTLIDHRLYRENCMKLNNMYVKDLRIINRDLSLVVMVDNSVVCMCKQLENGIVVPGFAGTRADSELGGLWVFLRQVISAEDVRIPLASKYSLKLLYQLYARIKAHD